MILYHSIYLDWYKYNYVTKLFYLTCISMFLYHLSNQQYICILQNYNAKHITIIYVYLDEINFIAIAFWQT